MIELNANQLRVSFPDLPMQPALMIDFQRTLRIPDDGKDYPLPPGLGSFPLRHIDDFEKRLPTDWLKRGGVLLPMWQSEALWLSFHSFHYHERRTGYPFAVKVATGKINAITGESWQRGLSRNPQNYLVVPEQPWLDGYCVEKGAIRQFVAMPLGQGYSVEEQLTGDAEFGGIQIEVFPMRPQIFNRRFPITSKNTEILYDYVQCCSMPREPGGMGLAPGGRMRQEIYVDPFSIHDWDLDHGSRCFVHLINSATWQAVTGQCPPSQPPTAKDYTDAGYPWYDYYAAEKKALQGSNTLNKVKSVQQKNDETGKPPLTANESVDVNWILNLNCGSKRRQVREAESFD